MRNTLPALEKRWLGFGLWVLVSLLLFAKTIAAVIQLSLHDDTASHIVLIPFMSAWLLYSERKKMPVVGSLAFAPAIAFLLPAILLGLFSMNCASCDPKLHLSINMLSLWFLLIAGFLLFMGKAGATASSFALAFLLFAIPIPDFLLTRIVYVLQLGSAAIADFFFNLSGAPVLREGFVFHLPKMSIEVAQECSGIRSSLALLILAVLVAHFSFRPLWKKLAFTVAGLVMMLIKNGIRISTLTLLANYVDPGFLYGRLHREGGIVFFLIGLVLLIPFYWILRKGEPTNLERGV